MNIQKSKKLNIFWLGQCPRCERGEHTVTTKNGTEKQLYEGDQVECWCGQTGIIETDGAGVAWCEWDKKPRTDIDNFNDHYREKFPKNWAVLPKSNHQACTHYHDCLGVWQAAKAQTVPEGFVLVPREPTDAMIKAGYQHCEPNGILPHSFYQAMIEAAEKEMDEAQEQGHD
jgi:hypothetical protein